MNTKKNAAPKPLVLDVDGSFLTTDMLFECFWAGLGKDPWATLSTSLHNITNPPQLKADLAKIANLRTDLLPVNEGVAELVDVAHSEGREVILASASNENLVSELARHHKMSDQIYASTADHNLKGQEKAEALVTDFGEGGFDYVGNETSDKAIWNVADTAIVVGSEKLVDNLDIADDKTVRIDTQVEPKEIIRALRPHQWVKNILLVLPVIAAHSFDLGTLGLVVLGMIAFSFAASSIYVVNDLLDLEADRLHPTKKNRPFAKGTVSIKTGMITCFVVGGGALAIAAALGFWFFGVIVLYMILSLAYSLRLKRMRWVDIATLASLYTLRVVAGAAASGVDASGFMLIFIFPIFITLGCVKRLTELTLATNDDRLPGRGYGRLDREDLVNVAGLGVVGALVIFFLYSFSEQAQILYPTQWLLWVALIPIAIWLIRMVVLGYQGQQDYDPIVFALKDKMGIGILLITLSLMFYAAGLWQQWFGF